MSVGVFRRRAAHVYFQRRRVWPTTGKSSVPLRHYSRPRQLLREPVESRVYYLPRPGPINLGAPTIGVTHSYRKEKHQPRRVIPAAFQLYQRRIPPMAVEAFVASVTTPTRVRRIQVRRGVQEWPPFHRRRLWYRQFAIGAGSAAVSVQAIYFEGNIPSATIYFTAALNSGNLYLEGNMSDTAYLEGNIADSSVYVRTDLNSKVTYLKGVID